MTKPEDVVRAALDDASVLLHEDADYQAAKVALDTLVLERDQARAKERQAVLKLAEEFGGVEGSATDFLSFVEVLRGRARGRP